MAARGLQATPELIEAAHSLRDKLAMWRGGHVDRISVDSLIDELMPILLIAHGIGRAEALNEPRSEYDAQADEARQGEAPAPMLSSFLQMDLEERAPGLRVGIVGREDAEGIDQAFVRERINGTAARLDALVRQHRRGQYQCGGCGEWILDEERDDHERELHPEIQQVRESSRRAMQDHG